MQKIIGYMGKCKQCSWVFAESKIANIPNLPARCEKCQKDMAIIPKFEDDNKGRTYEMSIFCKETGTTIRGGAVISNEDFKNLSFKELETKLITKICESFTDMLANKKQVNLLLQRG